jgi:hypothetical protein
VNRASILYDKMVNDFTNETLANAATTTNSNLIISMTSLEEQDEVGEADSDPERAEYLLLSEWLYGTTK